MQLELDQQVVFVDLVAYYGQISQVLQFRNAALDHLRIEL